MWDIADPSDRSVLPLAAGAGALSVILLLIVIICIYINCKKKKENRKTVEDMAVDENPVYQQYELVGPNYERQYSTHEVVDNNDYYG